MARLRQRSLRPTSAAPQGLFAIEAATEPQQYLGQDLRLGKPSHRADHVLEFTVTTDEPRCERVSGTLPRSEVVRRIWVKAERSATIVGDDPRAWVEDPGTEAVEEGLDQGDGAPLTVRGNDGHGIAVAGWRPAANLLIGGSGERGAAAEMPEVDFGVSGVSQVGRAGLHSSLDSRDQLGCAVGQRIKHLVGAGQLSEDHQPNSALGVGGRRVDLETMKFGLKRPSDFGLERGQVVFREDGAASVQRAEEALSDGA